MEIPLLPFQVDDVRKMHKFGGRVLNANDMGLGKTVETIAWWQANPYVVPVIILCPAFIKMHWEHEFKRYANVRCDVLEGQTPRRRLPIAPAPVVICNYDILQHQLPYLLKLKAQLIVIDECQNIRAPDRQLGANKQMYNIRTSATQVLCRGVPHVMALGGTGALENRPAEMFAVLNIIRPDKFNSFFTFAARYCGATKKSWGWEYKGATNLDNLHKRLRKCMMIRHRKEDVLDDLPERNRIIIPVETISSKELKNMQDSFRRWVRMHHGEHHRLKGAQRAEALNKLTTILKMCGAVKLKSVTKWIESFLNDTKDKIIIFAWHRSVIRKLSRHFGDMCVRVDGSTPKPLRNSAVKSFNTDKRIRLFICQLKAAGIGWSAKACATTATIEYWWNPAIHKQADDRVFGIARGDKGKPCFNYYFTARGTFEETMCEILQRKQKHIDAILDGGKSSKFNLLDQLIKEIARGK